MQWAERERFQCHRLHRACIARVQLWKHAMSFSAEMVLEGIAKAGSRGKCTPMGRAAMSLDLQALQRGMAELGRPRWRGGCC